VADRPRQLLTIAWGDGHQSSYPFEYLRWHCPCAECAGEAGLPGRLASTQSLRPEQAAMASVEAVGLFGIRPTWQDGHSIGIYGLALLRAICPCQACITQRSAGAEVRPG
jgi:DUF971 family protein